MTEPLHVLVYGTTEHGVCDFYRLGMYQSLLADEGIELRAWVDFKVDIPMAYADRPEAALRDGVATIARQDLDWADVVVFRRFYGTAPSCTGCDAADRDPAVMQAHAVATGHVVQPPREFLVRNVFAAMESDPRALAGRAIVYETDDDLLSIRPWTGFSAKVRAEHDLIKRMLSRADLVTVTTPVLAAVTGRYSDAVRVVRNAIDPRWYPAPASLPDLPGEPRILYYGTAIRLRDYEICREAVDDVRRRYPDTRRLWLGAAHDDAVRAAVDEALPYVKGVPAFARALVEARPDIGVAPVVGDDFDRAHSELHWLEYSMAGAATVASRTPGGGPYDVIRDGVDGLLARNRSDWRAALRRLAGSRDLRADLAGRARERVLADYDARVRVKEWADAYRWAAEHAGRGALGRRRAALVVPGRTGRGGLTAELERISGAERARAEREISEARVEHEARAALAHRRRVRREAEEAQATLARLRAGRDVCWPDEDVHDPLVTVRIPTYDRGALAVERSIASALAQTYVNLEILVVGDGAPPDAVEAISAVSDPRVRFINLSERGTYPADPELRWMVAGTPAVNHALELARGAWIAPLDDDDQFTPDHVETLLSVALEHRLEFVYGQSEMEEPDGSWRVLGAWPPAHAGFCHGSVLYSARLSFMRYDPEAWRMGEPGDWNLWRRMIEAGVRMGSIDQIVYRHHLEARHRRAVA